MARFTTDTIGRMVANPLPELNPLIAPLQTSMSNFNGAIQGEGTQGAIRKMDKANKDVLKQQVPKSVGDIMGGVRFAFRNRPENDLLQFLPDGLDAFHQAADDQIGNLLQEFVDALNANSDDLDQALIDEGQALLDGWTAVYAASESATAAKAMSEQERREARTAVADELFKVLNVLVSLFPNESDKVGLYMQQHLLGGPSTATPPGTGGGGGGGNSNSSEEESSSDSQPTNTSSSTSSQSSEPPSSSSEPPISSSSELTDPNSSSSTSSSSSGV